MRLFLSLIIFLLTASPTFARTTPEDIINEKKAAYSQKVINYSSENKLKLESFSQKIVAINLKKTRELEEIMERQSQILDEYVKRTNYQEDGGRDGITRNLSKPVENARYWITYTHEAIAYQQAKIYVYNLTSEKNLKTDAQNLLSTLQADLNSTKTKVANSQAILKKVVKGQ